MSFTSGKAKTKEETLRMKFLIVFAVFAVASAANIEQHAEPMSVSTINVTPIPPLNHQINQPLTTPTVGFNPHNNQFISNPLPNNQFVSNPLSNNNQFVLPLNNQNVVRSIQVLEPIPLPIAQTSFMTNTLPNNFVQNPMLINHQFVMRTIQVLEPVPLPMQNQQLQFNPVVGVSFIPFEFKKLIFFKS